MILLGAAVGVISSTQTWLTVTLASIESEELSVAGADALPLLAPLSLAALALGAALTIVGRVLVYVFGMITAAVGAILAAASVRIAANAPVESVASTVTDATGITGLVAVGDLVADAAPTVWPGVTVAAAVLITASGVFTLATAHRWAGAGRRYRSASASEDASGAGRDPSRPRDAIDSWDDLSRGEDPTN